MKTKRIFALILTIAMALSLAACGTKETTPSDDGQNPTEQTDPNKISISSLWQRRLRQLLLQSWTEQPRVA